MEQFTETETSPINDLNFESPHFMTRFFMAHTRIFESPRKSTHPKKMWWQIISITFFSQFLTTIHKMVSKHNDKVLAHAKKEKLPKCLGPVQNPRTEKHQLRRTNLFAPNPDKSCRFLTQLPKKNVSREISHKNPTKKFPTLFALYHIRGQETHKLGWDQMTLHDARGSFFLEEWFFAIWVWIMM